MVSGTGQPGSGRGPANPPPEADQGEPEAEAERGAGAPAGPPGARDEVGLARGGADHRQPLVEEVLIVVMLIIR
jgi:hypothetical protein